MWANFYNPMLHFSGDKTCNRSGSAGGTANRGFRSLSPNIGSVPQNLSKLSKFINLELRSKKTHLEKLNSGPESSPVNHFIDTKRHRPRLIAGAALCEHRQE